MSHAMLSLHIQTCEPKKSRILILWNFKVAASTNYDILVMPQYFICWQFSSFVSKNTHAQFCGKKRPNSMKTYPLHSFESQIERKRIKCLNSKHCVSLKICLDPNYKANDLSTIGSNHSSIQNKKECGIL